MGLASYVYWVEKGRRDIGLRAAPVRVSEILSRALFTRVPSVVLTGATLAVGKKKPFQFLHERLGVEEAAELQLGSPFNYRQQATLHIEKDLPTPASEDYIPAVSHAMKHYLHESRGRALVLFTSYEHMQDVSERLTPFLEEQGCRVLVQGSGMPRAKLLETFRLETGSVLFGTASFWQGVDVPGEALSCVVIARLPFAVPTTPVQEARLEDIAAEGKDPFRSYSLPQAVIRLKQGVGRLIRSKSDTGAIVILDSRIANRYYGRIFLESLPDCRIVRNG
jgi:ATP-dependent DNA helicase DinG